MIERLMLDTNIIIYSLGGNNKITDLINNTQHFISEITEIELLGFHGLGKQDEKIIKNYLSNVFIIGLNSIIKSTAINFKKVYRLKTIDAIIAASAVHFDLPLVTADRSFQKIKELESIIVEP
jgi:predicted nucleic acid-binding protein